MGTASGRTPTPVEQESGIRRPDPGLHPPDSRSLIPGVEHVAPDSRLLALPTVEERLFAEPFAFDFFQAVRLLQRLDPTRQPVGRGGPPSDEAVRFRALLSLSFPPSSIFDLQPPGADATDAVAGLPTPVMTVTFLGLTGPSGILPQHYTEQLLKVERDAKGPEKHAARDWFDLFNHRLIALFYRAWEKYRFYLPYERGKYIGPQPDPFTRALFSLVGLGEPTLRNRLRVLARPASPPRQETLPQAQEDHEGDAKPRLLAALDDLALLHFSGFLSHRPRCAVALGAMLRDYFQLPITVRQFQGQWLHLEERSCSTLSENNELGGSLVVGDKVWDAQSKFRLRVGPLPYAEFGELLPDRTPTPQRKTLFLLSHLTRLYAGPDFDFDVQIVLKAADVPECHLAETAENAPRLGWNTWIRSVPFSCDADDAVFEGENVVYLN